MENLCPWPGMTESEHPHLHDVQYSHSGNIAVKRSTLYHREEHNHQYKQKLLGQLLSLIPNINGH